MNRRITERFIILLAGLLTGLLAAGVVSLLETALAGIWLGRLLAVIITLLTLGIAFALVHAATGQPDIKAEGLTAGLFAGAFGGILIWAIGGLLLGPFHLGGALLAGLIGGALFALQVDPKPA